jgi:hypothetical protein
MSGARRYRPRLPSRTTPSIPDPARDTVVGLMSRLTTIAASLPAAAATPRDRHLEHLQPRPAKMSTLSGRYGAGAGSSREHDRFLEELVAMLHQLRARNPECIAVLLHGSVTHLVNVVLPRRGL